MIQFLADGIDQLDIALDQLAIRDRNFDRFALMLIDNVVELTLHRYAQDRASENELWTRLQKPKFDPKSIESALGQNFDGKVKLAAKLELLDKAASESILNLHAFRNTAYHRGLRHERILHSLALFYFIVACKLLKSFEPRFWSWSSNDTISHRARKYLGDVHGMMPEDTFRAAYERLSDVAESMKPNLIEDLTADMSATVDDTDSAIQFLADDSPEPVSRDRAVVLAQAWATAFTEEARAFARDKGHNEEFVVGRVERLAAEYPWPFKRDPIPGWRTRVATLGRDTDPHRALKRYCDFMRQTETFRATLDEAAAELDGFIQHQIDQARGK